MFRTKTMGLILIALALVAGGGYYYYNNVSAQAQEPAEQTIRTTRVRRGDLVITASGSAELIPADDVSLGFTNSGVLAEVLVELGDQVHVGDALARLDDLQARKTLVAAQLQIAQAEDTLARKLDAEAAEREVALAETKLAQAQLKLDELLNWTPDEGAIERAQANLDAAQTSYEAVWRTLKRPMLRPGTPHVTGSLAIPDAAPSWRTNVIRLHATWKELHKT